MSRYYSYLNSAKEILAAYSGQEPFASFIKKYFSQHKKYGSKDRKQISHLCYSYFRTASPSPEGGIRKPLSVSDHQLLEGLFLCSVEPNEMLAALKPEWNDKVSLPLKEKCSMFNPQFSISNVFPWKDELSGEIDHEKFCESFLIQPDLFIRIRPHHAEQVLLKLDKAGVEYEFISPFTVRLPNSFKADQYFDINKEVVIQDYSSQQIAHFLPVDHGKPIRVWDCCAASGGKSIMSYDVNPAIELIVSDVRESILVNLKKRFAEGGIHRYKYFKADLTNEDTKALPLESGDGFDLIICDAPCSGSGTWSRTPEQLFYFEKRRVDDYATLQKKIVTNVIPHLKPGGYLLYVTCSVFKKENEEVVDFIKNNFSLAISRMELLKGYDKKADTMFAALLQKPL